MSGKREGGGFSRQHGGDECGFSWAEVHFETEAKLGGKSDAQIAPKGGVFKENRKMRINLRLLDTEGYALGPSLVTLFVLMLGWLAWRDFSIKCSETCLAEKRYMIW